MVNAMRVFFTADCHFGHDNIVKYAKRPFKDGTHMNSEIVKRWNKTVNSDDLVYHVGDFAFKNNTLRFERLLNGTIVHIAGNHDLNNGVKSLIMSAQMHFGKHSVYVRHKPLEDPEWFPPSTDFMICGHVHKKWKYNIYQGVAMINVGVDVWGYQPVSLDSILKYFDELYREYGPHGTKW